jgi:GxxExxY protein
MIHHRGAEGTEVTEEEDAELSHSVIGAAIEVHRHLGPGLLESIYEATLCHELSLRGVAFERQVIVPIEYKGLKIRPSLRVDLLVARRLVVEVKAIEHLAEIHRAQLLTYLRLSGLRLGLLINFNVEVLITGVRRIING